MDSVTKLGLGTVQFGIPYGISNRTGQTPAEEVFRILEIALENGIHVLDSASDYGDAEQVLGEQNLSGFRIVSKFIPPADNEKVERQLLRSLTRMKVDSLAGYLAHHPLELLEDPSQWEELLAIRKRGLVEKIGYSLNSPGELERLMEAGFIPDLVQVPFNYFDRRFLPYFGKLKVTGCEIHARSVFLQGLFFMSTQELGGFFDPVKPILRALQKQRESLPGSLLRIVVEQPLIDKVILGVESGRQLSENLRSMESAGCLPDPNEPIPEAVLTPSKWPQKHA